ncbi:MAG TPA: hypothetical protein VKA36_10860 [Solirubrobacterales bacterium]|nr:hypothetical protein [Solirubrobacterales bacterium]
MEAATTTGAPLLTRDGALPVAPSETANTDGRPGHPIDGVARCAACERLPLVGELVVLHTGRKRSGWVCERCEAAGRGDRIGPATEHARIRSFGGAMNVRRTA